MLGGYDWQNRGRQLALYMLVALALLLLYLIFMFGQFKGLADTNALDYAQIARNLARGEGFTTQFIKPLSLTRSLRISQHPDVTYPPLHPWITSLFMRMLGPNQRAAALACGVPFLLSVPLVFILGLWLFDYRTAWLAVGLYVTSMATLGYSISGLEVSLLTLLFIGLVMVLYQYGQALQRRQWLAAGAGLLLGLIYLTKYIWVLSLIPVLIYLYYSTLRRQRSRTLLTVVAVLFVVIIPWCFRMYAVTGNPFFSWRWYETTMLTRSNPGMTLYRSFPEQLETLPTHIIRHPVEIYEKVRSGVGRLYLTLNNLGGPYVTAFFIVAILVPLGTRNFERIRYLLYGTYAIIFLALVIVQPGGRLLYPLAPLITLIAAGFFLRIFRPLVQNMGPREQIRYTVIAVGALLIVHTVPLGISLTERTRPGEEPQGRIMERWSREAAGLAGAGPIITDVPWLLAWHGDIPAIWLPRSTEDLERMQQAVGQIQWLLLTPLVARAEKAERTEEWAKPWRASLSRDIEPFHGFVVHERIGDGSWILYRKMPFAAGTNTEQTSE